VREGTRTHEPGVSGMMTLSIASLPSPSSARSAMNRSRLKLMLAPDTTETKRLFLPMRLFCWMYFLAPATPRAPDGSGTERVSAGAR